MNPVKKTVSSPTDNAEAIQRAYQEGAEVALNRWDALVKVVTDNNWTAESKEFQKALEVSWPDKKGADRQAKYECRLIAATAKFHDKIKSEALKLSSDSKFRQEINAGPAQMYPRIAQVVKTDGKMPSHAALKKRLVERTDPKEPDLKKAVLGLFDKMLEKKYLNVNEARALAEKIEPPVSGDKS